jgi:uncharacterized membrane protein
MIEKLIQGLQGLPAELIVMIVSALPISELRGGIPLGMALYNFSVVKSFWLSVIGNCIPVIPALLLFKPVSEFLSKWGPLKRFLNWFFEKTKKRAKIVEKYEAIGLALFVGVPLPLTGAWTGCIVARLFKLRFKYSVIAIISGVFIAGIIVAILSFAGMGMIRNFQSLNR